MDKQWFRVTRTWLVLATDSDDAAEKATPGTQTDVHIQRIPPENIQRISPDKTLP